MPHINDDQKVKIDATNRPDVEGDLCWLFARGALTEYNKNPRWSSIHKIRVALRSPYHTEWSHLIIQQYMTGYSKVDIEAAADLAFFEFYRIVAARYEDAKIAANGNAFAGAIITGFNDTVPLGKLEPMVVRTTTFAESVPVKRKPGRPKKEVING